METQKLLDYLGYRATPELINSINNNFNIELKNKKKKSLMDIYLYFCKVYNLEITQIFNKKRYRNIMRAKQEATYVAYQLGYSKKEIGSFINAHRTTILHTLEIVKDEMYLKETYRNKMNEHLKYLSI